MSCENSSQCRSAGRTHQASMTQDHVPLQAGIAEQLTLDKLGQERGMGPKVGTFKGMKVGRFEGAKVQGLGATTLPRSTSSGGRCPRTRREGSADGSVDGARRRECQLRSK